MAHPGDTTAAVDAVLAPRNKPTRRQLVAGAAATLGGLGILGVPTAAVAQDGRNDPQTILNIAATAEVLATIVNTVGWERGLGRDRVTQRNLRAAAREELIHYDVLVASGGQSLTKRIWVPDAVFENRRNLLNTLQVGDQIFINAYLIATTAFAQAGEADLSRIAAEFMGVEAVHRALARQSLRQLGNDRAFMKYFQAEEAPGAPNQGQTGFTDVIVAAQQLQSAGFGFGEANASPGAFYEFDEVRQRTPDPRGVNTRTPL